MGHLGGGFKCFLFSPRKLGKISHLTDIFQMGWFNHQPDIHLCDFVSTQVDLSGADKFHIFDDWHRPAKDSERYTWSIHELSPVMNAVCT